MGDPIEFVKADGKSFLKIFILEQHDDFTNAKTPFKLIPFSTGRLSASISVETIAESFS